MHPLNDTDTSQIKEELEKNGYICLPLLSPEDCQELLDWHHKNQYAFGSGFRVTLFSDNIEYRFEAHELILKVFSTALEKLFPGYTVIVGNFVTKDPTLNSEVPLHQDWTFVDEAKHRSINIWCPLGDTYVENGALQVVAGSHLISKENRGPGLPSAFMINSPAIRDLLQPIPLKAGHAICYDHALIHASGPNQSHSERVAVTMSLMPDEAQLRHCQLGELDGKEVVEVLHVKPDFFKTLMIGEKLEL